MVDVIMNNTTYYDLIKIAMGPLCANICIPYYFTQRGIYLDRKKKLAFAIFYSSIVL